MILTLLAFVREKTAAGVTHDQIAAQLAAGDWTGSPGQPPRPRQEEAPSWEQPKRQPEAQAAPLAIMAQTLTGELAAAREREQALWERVVAAEAARARGGGACRRQGRPGPGFLPPPVRGLTYADPAISRCARYGLT